MGGEGRKRHQSSFINIITSLCSSCLLSKPALVSGAVSKNIIIKAQSFLWYAQNSLRKEFGVDLCLGVYLFRQPRLDELNTHFQDSREGIFANKSILVIRINILHVFLRVRKNNILSGSFYFARNFFWATLTQFNSPFIWLLCAFSKRTCLVRGRTQGIRPSTQNYKNKNE